MENTKVRPVWDWTVRLCHWAMVGLVAAMWWTAEYGVMDWHRRLGVILIGIVVFRLYWGFVGTKTARFSEFIKGPGAIFAYFSKLTTRPYTPGFGHNPVGALSVVAMLLALVAQLTTGLFSVDVDGLESGPLSGWVSFEVGRMFADWHEAAFNALVALIGLHVAAVAFYLLALKVNLIGPMVTGRSRQVESSAPIKAPIWKVAVGLMLSVAIIYFIANA